MTPRPGFAVDPGWRVLWHALGVSPTDVLRRAALPVDLLSRPREVLSTAEFFALWRALEIEVADPLLPLRLGELYTAEAFAPPLFAALCSPDLIHAARRLSCYKALVGAMAIDVGESRGELTLTYRWLDPAEPPAGLVLAEFAFITRLARIATREPVQAVRLSTRARPAPSLSAAYKAYFGVRPTLGAKCSISFSRGDAERVFLTRNDGMWAVFEPALRQRLADLDTGASTADRVRASLLELLPSGRGTLGGVALALGTSTRTLQRRLQADGTPFQRVLDRTREELALHYLRRTAVPVAEVSFLLGFADPSSFYRAFHVWTGKTPEGIRSGP